MATEVHLYGTRSIDKGALDVRITADTWRDFFTDCPEVFLNGNKIDHVLEADDKAGYVIVSVYDETGRLATNEAGDGIATRRIEGSVSIKGRMYSWVQ